MVKMRLHRFVLAAILLVMSCSLLVIGCMGAGEETTTSLSVGGTAGTNLGSTSTDTVTGPNDVDAEMLSTFKAKDPFIQQAVPISSTTLSSVVTTSSTTPGTTYHPGTSTTYHPSTTSTTRPPTTTTTSPHLHSLKVLSVGVVGGSGAVTFQVDNSVYKDRRKGDVVSTSWGQVKVLDISTSSKVVTLLHGSETLVLAVGQQVYE